MIGNWSLKLFCIHMCMKSHMSSYMTVCSFKTWFSLGFWPLESCHHGLCKFPSKPCHGHAIVIVTIFWACHKFCFFIRIVSLFPSTQPVGQFICLFFCCSDDFLFKSKWDSEMNDYPMTKIKMSGNINSCKRIFFFPLVIWLFSTLCWTTSVLELVEWWNNGHTMTIHLEFYPGTTDISI